MSTTGRSGQQVAPAPQALPAGSLSFPTSQGQAQPLSSPFNLRGYQKQKRGHLYQLLHRG